MSEALMVLTALNAALTAGMNVVEALDRISSLVRERHATGRTMTAQDLIELFDAGDQLEAQVRAQLNATISAR